MRPFVFLWNQKIWWSVKTRFFNAKQSYPYFTDVITRNIKSLVKTRENIRYFQPGDLSCESWLKKIIHLYITFNRMMYVDDRSWKFMCS